MLELILSLGMWILYNTFAIPILLVCATAMLKQWKRHKGLENLPIKLFCTGAVGYLTYVVVMGEYMCLLWFRSIML